MVILIIAGLIQGKDVVKIHKGKEEFYGKRK